MKTLQNDVRGSDFAGSTDQPTSPIVGRDSLTSGDRPANEWSDNSLTFGSRLNSEYFWGDNHRSTRTLYEQGQSSRGISPKSYEPTNERIRENINELLHSDHQIHASDIIVSVIGGEVKLSGTVPSREDKRRLEDLIESILGVSYVENGLRVNRAEG
jgi:hypothetical protein